MPLKEITNGITRWCEWGGSLDTCTVAWGSSDSQGAHSCLDGSAKENCSRLVRIRAINLTKGALKRLHRLGDVE